MRSTSRPRLVYRTIDFARKNPRDTLLNYLNDRGYIYRSLARNRTIARVQLHYHRYVQLSNFFFHSVRIRS